MLLITACEICMCLEIAPDGKLGKSIPRYNANQEIDEVGNDGKDLSSNCFPMAGVMTQAERRVFLSALTFVAF